MKPSGQGRVPLNGVTLRVSYRYQEGLFLRAVNLIDSCRKPDKELFNYRNKRYQSKSF